MIGGSTIFATRGFNGLVHVKDWDLVWGDGQLDASSEAGCLRIRPK
jgi:hypothetical protein